MINIQLDYKFKKLKSGAEVILYTQKVCDSINELFNINFRVCMKRKIKDSISENIHKYLTENNFIGIYSIE